jgi:hypothetical protein
VPEPCRTREMFADTAKQSVACGGTYRIIALWGVCQRLLRNCDNQARVSFLDPASASHHPPAPALLLWLGDDSLTERGFPILGWWTAPARHSMVVHPAPDDVAFLVTAATRDCTGVAMVE